MKVALICFSLTGQQTGERLCRGLEAAGMTAELDKKSKYLPDSIQISTSAWAGEKFSDSDALIFIGATGIAVRSIAPYAASKKSDPAVLVVDECGKFVISLLSGHLGGANELALKTAEILDAIPVVTTATDLHHRFAVDVFAKKNHLHFTEREAAKQISAAVLDGKQVGLWIGEGLVFEQEDFQKSCLKELILCGSQEELYSFAEEHPVIVITKTAEEGRQFVESLAGSLWGDVRNNVCGCERKPCILLLYPINITAGVGCRKQISKELFEKGLNDVLEGYGLEPTQLKQLASIDLKKEEPAILAYAQKYKVPFATYPAEQLEKITEVSATSRFVKQVTGVDNVCERAARTADADGELLCPKCIREQMTVALTETEVTLQF